MTPSSLIARMFNAFTFLWNRKKEREIVLLVPVSAEMSNDIVSDDGAIIAIVMGMIVSIRIYIHIFFLIRFDNKM